MNKLLWPLSLKESLYNKYEKEYSIRISKILESIDIINYLNSLNFISSIKIWLDFSKVRGTILILQALCLAYWE